jgi:hypothetical protein
MKSEETNEHTKEQQLVALNCMHRAKNEFYRAAQESGVHTFLEFTGLMHEYIQLCESAMNAGIEFRTSANLPMKDHHAKYLAEKLNCIFGPTLLRREEELRNAFIHVLFDGHFRLQLIEPGEDYAMVDVTDEILAGPFTSGPDEDEWEEFSKNVP